MLTCKIWNLPLEPWTWTVCTRNMFPVKTGVLVIFLDMKWTNNNGQTNVSNLKSSVTSFFKLSSLQHIPTPGHLISWFLIIFLYHELWESKHLREDWISTVEPPLVFLYVTRSEFLMPYLWGDGFDAWIQIILHHVILGIPETFSAVAVVLVSYITPQKIPRLLRPKRS